MSEIFEIMARTKLQTGIFKCNKNIKFEIF